MKGNSYKKTSTAECIFCDYYKIKCRKNKKCNVYKRLAKQYPRKRKINKLSSNFIEKIDY